MNDPAQSLSAHEKTVTLESRSPARAGPSLMQRRLLIGAGLLCVGLGALGAVLPVLPTTPFLLLAAGCFARSSPRLHRWLYGNRWIGPYLRNYAEGRAITLRHLIHTLVSLWLGLGATAVFATDKLWLRLLLLAIGLGVTIHLSRLRRAPEEPRRR
jgi:hypothetical protein